MSRNLKLLRYGLISVPALIAVYYYSGMDNDRFVLDFLLLLLIAVIGDRTRNDTALSRLFAVMELLYSAWLFRTFGFLLLFPAISALLAYSRHRPAAWVSVLALLHLSVLNEACWTWEPLLRITVNLVFVLASTLNGLLLGAGRGREDTEYLYDELRKKHYELEEARARLLQFAAQVEDAAQTEERVRISRQLHDDIGHRLIRAKMMMEAAIHTLPVAPEQGMALMGQIRDQLAASMDDMRSAVRRIHGAPRLEGAYALDRLLEETGRDTGIRTSYAVSGMPYPLYPSQQVVLYNNAREAITNALRHGKASALSISLHYMEGEVTMEVGNDGRLPDEADCSRMRSGGGLGLKGMQERTQMVGGRIEVVTAPQFAVITRLPVFHPGEAM
ncbi:sensor histidine kinase [Paenibacillus sp. NFR01]|uniref:sensor histidine kinase n=1 Tax=Paenibacillus sp. NFR01 TaxID=1566279 RepID=UPI0008BECAF6|nr:sensor histidine kinase [Paenibacillus sp. NFR01]SEU14920.1 Signal transduction histidine kinase [Paenibacillus sp. NFR01]